MEKMVATMVPTGKERHVPGVFWKPNEGFVDSLAEFCRGRRVLEVFAGNGYMAGLLAARGVDVVATSVLSGMDCHSKGMWHDVWNCDAVSAVREFGGCRDLLLMCWPTVTEKAEMAAREWGGETVFVGEVTDYSKNWLGGCATDSFFERMEVLGEISGYRGNMLEKALVMRHDGLVPAPSRRVGMW